MFERYNVSKMPGHWLLSRLGKKVLRPGGKVLTFKMMEALNINSLDKVVEFAPGMGVTAQLIFDKSPVQYWGVDQNEEAIRHLKAISPYDHYTFVKENIIQSTLKDNIASVVLGEAVLTMQTGANKQKIINEAFRILQKNGRYGIHEIGITPNDMSEHGKDQIRKALSDVIHVNARPLTISEWQEMLEKAGFVVEKVFSAPMHLLKLSRLVQDEGCSGVAKMVAKMFKTQGAWARISAMRSVFNKYEQQMNAVSFVAIKR